MKRWVQDSTRLCVCVYVWGLGGRTHTHLLFYTQKKKWNPLHIYLVSGILEYINHSAKCWNLWPFSPTLTHTLTHNTQPSGQQEIPPPTRCPAFPSVDFCCFFLSLANFVPGSIQALLRRETSSCPGSACRRDSCLCGSGALWDVCFVFGGGDYKATGMAALCGREELICFDLQ